MMSGQRRVRRRLVAIAAAAVAASGGPRAMADTPAQWLTATSGSWTDPARWSTNPYYPNNGTPDGAAYAATIAAAGSTYAVSLNANVAVDSLTLASATATMDQAYGTLSLGGTLDVQAGTYDLAGGTIAGGRIQAEGGTFNAQGGTLDNVTLAVPVATTTGTPLILADAITLAGSTVTVTSTQPQSGSGPAYAYASGNLTVGGTGQVVFNGTIYGSFGAAVPGTTAGTTTIGPGVTISTGTGIGSGSIGGNVPASGYGLVNQGTINVASGVVSLAGRWTNQGTVNVTGGTLRLLGTYGTADLGRIVHTGGSVELDGTLNNVGQTLALNATSGSLTLNGGTVNGGTVTAAGGATLVVSPGTISSGTLANVTLGTDLPLGGPAPGGSLTVTGGLALNGHTLTLPSSVGLGFSGNLSGPGTVVATGLPNSSGYSAGLSGTFSVGPGVTLETSPVVVNGSGGLGLSGTWVNHGTILALSTSMPVSLGGSWTNAGTLQLSSGATAYLGGTFTPASIGQVVRAADGTDTLSVIGTVSNAGATLDTANTGPLTLNGATINGGRIAATAAAAGATPAGLTVGVGNPFGGATLTVLDNVTLAAPLTVAAGGTCRVNDGLTLDGGSVTLAGSANGLASVTFLYAQSVGGTGTFVMAATKAGTAIVTAPGITFGPGVTATTTAGGTGTIGGQVEGYATFQGTATAAAGGSLTVANATFQGTATPAVGGTVTLATCELQGTATAPTGTTLVLLNPDITTGTAATTGGTVTLAGTVPAAQIALVQNPAKGTVSVTGSIPNAGQTLTLAGIPGQLVLNGATVVGGNVAFADPSLVVQSLTLNGSTVPAGATLTAASNGGVLTLAAAVTNAGAIAAPTGAVYVTGTLVNSGTLTASRLSDNGSINVSAGSIAAGTITGGTGTLLVGGGATVALTPRPSSESAAATVSVLAGLTISPGGGVDVSNNDLIVRNGSLATLSAAAAAGFAGGVGAAAAGLASSTAAADPRHLMAVGVVQNATTIGGTTAIYTTFDGQSISATDVLVKYTYYGDANLDGVVNAADYARIDAGYVMHLTGWQNGDFNYDGVVDGSDYTLVDNAFNQQLSAAGSPSAAAALAVATAVPEPDSAMAVMTLTAMVVGRRRRRRRGRASPVDVRRQSPGRPVDDHRHRDRPGWLGLGGRRAVRRCRLRRGRLGRRQRGLRNGERGDDDQHADQHPHGPDADPHARRVAGHGRRRQRHGRHLVPALVARRPLDVARHQHHPAARRQVDRLAARARRRPECHPHDLPGVVEPVRQQARSPRPLGPVRVHRPVHRRPHGRRKVGRREVPRQRCPLGRRVAGVGQQGRQVVGPHPPRDRPAVGRVGEPHEAPRHGRVGRVGHARRERPRRPARLVQRHGQVHVRPVAPGPVRDHQRPQPPVRVVPHDARHLRPHRQHLRRRRPQHRRAADGQWHRRQCRQQAGRRPTAMPANRSGSRGHGEVPLVWGRQGT